MKEKLIHILSHTHWDREWYLNSKYVNHWLIPFFDALFAMLDREQSYKFVLDGQTLIIEDLLEQVAENNLDPSYYNQKIKQYVMEKRLVIGPYYLQPDWQLISEEAIVRNLLYGRKIAAAYGGAMPVGWLLDNFGQISQIPQIHQGFGLNSLFVWRGLEMDPENVTTEFEWFAPDGSSVLGIFLLSSYRNAMRLADLSEIMQDRLSFEAEKLAPFLTTGNVLMMNGYDQEMFPDDILPHLCTLAADENGCRVTQSTPEEYAAAIRAEKPVLQPLTGQQYCGRFVSVFPGILSSRMYIKQRNDTVQRLAERYTEPICAILSCMGRRYPAESLENAWKLILKNHPHDSICGVGIDDIYTDMQERYDLATDILHFEMHRAYRSLAGNIHTAALPDADAAYVAFNPLAFTRDALLYIPCSPAQMQYFSDDKAQRLESVKVDGGYLVKAKDIPALGYMTLYAHDDTAGDIAQMQEAPPLPMLENAWMQVHIHPNGTLSVLDKRTNTRYTDLLTFEDTADAGDEYNYSHIQKDTPYRSANVEAKITLEENNALRQTYRIETHMSLPCALTENRQSRTEQTRLLPLVTRITLAQHSPVLEFETSLRNTVKDHRLRVLFPTDIKSDVSYAQTQFDVCTHAIGRASYPTQIPDAVNRAINGAYEPLPAVCFPQRNFSGIGDGQKGVAILNAGLPEYEVLPKRSTLALTLFRSVGSIARSDLLSRNGDAGPAIATPDAQCLRDMRFSYGFYPHGGTWADAKVTSVADAFSTKVSVWKTGIHPGVLPPQKQFFAVEDSANRVAVSCCKCAEDGLGIVLRLYNNTDVVADASLQFAFPILRAELMTLSEETIAPILPKNDHAFCLPVAPKKIVTVRIVPQMQDVLLHHEAHAPLLIEEPPRQEDFSSYGGEAVVSAEDVQAETARAVRLEQAYAQSLQALDAETDATPLAHSLRIMQMETVHRESLEARLSATLIWKKHLMLHCKDNAELKSALSDIDQTLRKLGMELNNTRIAKRSQEYIVDYYRHQKDDC